MAKVTGGSQVEVPCEDKNFESAPNLKELEVKTGTKDGPSDLPTGADRIEGMKHGVDVLKKKGGSEREGDEVNGSEGDENEEDEIEGDATEEEESEGDENEEEFESEGDENEDGSEGDVNEEEDESEGDVNEEEDGSEGVENEEDMNGGDENQKLADGADFDSKHVQKVEEEGAGRKDKVETLVTELVTKERNINKDGGEGEMAAADVFTNSKKDEAEMVKGGKDAKNRAKEENLPIKKAKGARRRHKTTTDVAASKEDNKSGELLNAGKKEALDVEEVKMVDGMGLIFMCNAKTKQDCFHYKILGLPASKKELVEKIYKGMRLFLFDVDLKLMYGIFKAVTPGGYNIEPKAFKSAYPAQVRFRVLNDCVPLPEEKFKAAIRENYYGKNKFSNQLSSEQVKKLCKIFQSTSKIAKKKRPRGISNAETAPTPPSKRPRGISNAETVPTLPSKRARRTKTDVRTVRPDPKPVRRAVDVIRAKPALVRTSSYGRGRDPRKHREAAKPVHMSSRAHKRSQPERERRWHTPPAPLPSRREQAYPSRREAYESPHRSRARDLDPYRGRREIIQDLPPPRRVLSPPPAPITAAAAPYDYYYRHDPPPTRRPLMVDPYGVFDSETRHLLPRDSHVTEYHRDALSMYREPRSLYHAPPAYDAPPPAHQNAYVSTAAAAYGHPPLYYRY